MLCRLLVWSCSIRDSLLCWIEHDRRWGACVRVWWLVICYRCVCDCVLVLAAWCDG